MKRAAEANAAASLVRLQESVVRCAKCLRLRRFCEEVGAKRRRAFADEAYWMKPVPSWGDPEARVLFVGLAPAAHGANRTGRMFTGDRSGDFLYAALYRAGWASQTESRFRDDGLRLRNVYITAAVRCAPPANRPLPEEIARCRPFLEEELRALPRLRVIVTLGKLAHDQVLQVLAKRGEISRRSAFPFGHGREYALAGGLHVLCSYHPSQQNTFTGKLTAAMMDALLQRAGKLSDDREV